MTRDKAIKIWDEAWSRERLGTSEDIIRGFEKLGMLKLDEPKSEEAKRTEMNWALARAFRDWERGFGPHVDLLGHVEAAGLKIVEK